MKKFNYQIVLAIGVMLCLVLITKVFAQSSINDGIDRLVGNTGDMEESVTHAGEYNQFDPGIELELEHAANTDIAANLVENNETNKAVADLAASKPQENSETTTKDNSASNLPTHQVVRGESLFLISRKYGLQVEEIKSLNNLVADEITIGQVLTLPAVAQATSQVMQTASRNSINHQFNDKDIYWLAKIIHAEARGESYEGQLAVGAVIINRVKSAIFPNTVYGVIFEKWDNKYYQFSPVLDGTINLEPNQTAYRAAREVLTGWDLSGGALYFYNPEKSTNRWIFDRPIIKKIGKHVFTL
jgi:N-acetylmuramoyl-L-alanine amidase